VGCCWCEVDVFDDLFCARLRESLYLHNECRCGQLLASHPDGMLLHAWKPAAQHLGEAAELLCAEVAADVAKVGRGVPGVLKRC
jgi:hypothetical protein